MFEPLIGGFATAFSLTNLMAAGAGVLLGTLAGVLPGLGIAGTVAVLLPLTYSLDPLTALILISGVFFGSQYGGSTTSILVNIPGEATSVVTAIDGHAMAQKGKAGKALGIAAIGSFVAGTMGIVALSFSAPTIARAALAFGPPEYFAVAVLGLVILASTFSKSPMRSLLMIIVGMMIGTIGLDPVLGASRFTMEFRVLDKGIDFVVMLMGVFGLAEIFAEIGRANERRESSSFAFRDLYPNRKELAQSAGPIVRGGVIGFLMGLIPGPSAIIATFASYAVEKRVSRTPDEFGKGALAGVAGPESANNSAMYAQMVPLISLGIPFSASMALLLSGFVIHGLTPGPLLMVTNPDIFWGLIASLYIGNVMLLIINLPLVGVFASVLRVRFSILLPLVTIVMFAGAYSINNSLFDLAVLLVFGIVGFFFRQAGLDLTALVLGAFLGPMIESSLTQALSMSNGSFAIFFTRPISGTILLVAIGLLVIALGLAARRWRTNEKPGI
ncbi:tripartite tricarboxylate transporter permease [Devosia elaeis]|uniref:Transporter n=1 Tax=Devosia elaeis TaxID=1770058 RepID=A0A178HJL7_9HYPH|nr:tripartite tricarboxylate transporter permease [Devosia elaeis]OAM72987.1 transporter [Devosia elaeis]